MIIKLDTEAVMNNMKELCTQLLGQESYQQLRRCIDEFSVDEPSLQQYESFMEKHQHLQQYEEQGLEPPQNEIDDYEQAELALYDNDLIRRFLHAQRQFTQLHNAISQYFTKTVEYNRLPDAKELKTGGCGCGGNCGGNH